MKFIVSSSLLYKQLDKIVHIISSKPIISILENLLFEVVDDLVYITASDLEIIAKVNLSVTATGNVKFALPSKVLIELLKNLPDQPLTFDVDELYHVSVTSSSGQYQIAGLSPDDYPKSPLLEGTENVEVPCNTLLTAINKTLIAIGGEDEIKKSMSGVFFEILDDRINFVATDSHRLVRYTYMNVQASAPGSALVPRKPLAFLKSSLPDKDDLCKIRYNAQHLFIVFENVTMSCRLIEEKYPNYAPVIPEKSNFCVSVLKKDMESALKRVNAFTDKSTNHIIIRLDGNQLSISGQDTLFNISGTEKLSCQYDGDSMSLSFNVQFFIEMLASIETTEVEIHINSPNHVVPLLPKGQDKSTEFLFQLMMPLAVS
ncbi:MAG: DNA polymerase III subunit beta [Phycisphaerales bacterium]|nr:DNA polymerase III subunit beta [Phycisphaerales bacterium]